jgi:hypothetical protein
MEAGASLPYVQAHLILQLRVFFDKDYNLAAELNLTPSGSMDWSRWDN